LLLRSPYSLWVPPSTGLPINVSISISITIVIAAMAVYALSSPWLLARGVAGARGQWTGVG